MASNKVAISEGDVQGLFNDKETLRKFVEGIVQSAVDAEYEKHMGRSRYERGKGRDTHRNGYKDRSIITRVGKIYLRVPQARDGSFSPSVYEKYQRVEKALFLTLVETYRKGVATRKIQAITEELCGDRVPGSTISAWCKKLDSELEEFRERRFDRNYPYVVVDAQVHRVRRNHAIVPEAALVAEGINESGFREVIGVSMGDSESERTWREFFLSLRKRGLQNVRMLVSDDHAGLVNAARMCFQGCQWQRCQFHFKENAKSRVLRRKRSEISRRIMSIWNAFDRKTADLLIREFLQDYGHYGDLCNWLEENIEDCLAVLELPPEHRRRLRTTNGVERMHEEIKRRTIPIRIFPSRESALRMITALWQDIHENWITGRCYTDMELLKEWEAKQEIEAEVRDPEGVVL